MPDSDSPRSRTRSSPSSIAGAVTCSGTTKSGEPCKNTVKRPTALGHVDSDADQEIERYCHLHIKEVLKPSGFQSSLANEWVSYDGMYFSVSYETSNVNICRLDPGIFARGHARRVEARDEQACVAVRPRWVHIHLRNPRWVHTNQAVLRRESSRSPAQTSPRQVTSTSKSGAL